MYGFVDATTRVVPRAPMSLQTIFNGVNLDDVLSDEDGSFMTLTVSGRSNITQRISTFNVPGRDGVVEQNSPVLEPREIIVKYKIKDKTNEGFRDRYNRLNGLLTGARRVLSFTDENALFYATLSNGDVPEEDSNELIGSITFFCSDPFKYGPEISKSHPTDEITIRNNGTAEATPIFELTAKKKVTFAMITNAHEEYNLIGKPADVDEQIVDERTILFSEDGSTISDWTHAGTSVDGGDVSGSFGSDGAGITAPDYGSGDKWHGPAVIKEVPPVQDFEVTANLQLRETNIKQTSRIEVYLYDENMKTLGKIAIMDNTTNQYTKKGEGRFGPFEGINKNYVISSRNYNYTWDYFFGMLRIRRVGKEFEFYITRINTATKHVYSLKETYVDTGNEFGGKLKYIQIHIATYGKGPQAYSAKFFNVSAYKLEKVKQDQTPYILDVGDVLTFDHKDEEILINGEPRMDLKNFGGSFFSLNKGQNMILVSPEDSFDSKIIYREKYL